MTQFVAWKGSDEDGQPCERGINVNQIIGVSIGASDQLVVIYLGSTFEHRMGSAWRALVSSPWNSAPTGPRRGDSRKGKPIEARVLDLVLPTFRRRRASRRRGCEGSNAPA